MPWPARTERPSGRQLLRQRSCRSRTPRRAITERAHANESGRAYGLTCCVRSETTVRTISRTRRSCAVSCGRCPSTRAAHGERAEHTCAACSCSTTCRTKAPGARGALNNKYLVFVASCTASSTATRGNVARGRADGSLALSVLHRLLQGPERADFVRYIKSVRSRPPSTSPARTTTRSRRAQGALPQARAVRFAHEHQGLPAEALQRAFRAFVERVAPANLASPTWRPGASSLETAVIGTSA